MRTATEINREAQRFQVRRDIDQEERARLQELHRKPSPGDARLVRPTLVRCLRSFCVAGQPIQQGTSVSVPWDIAQSLIAIGKAEAL